MTFIIILAFYWLFRKLENYLPFPITEQTKRMKKVNFNEITF